MTSRSALASMLLIAALSATPAGAAIPLGATAPNFTKTALGGASVSLSQYSGKVVVLFLLGYG